MSQNNPCINRRPLNKSNHTLFDEPLGLARISSFVHLYIISFAFFPSYFSHEHNLYLQTQIGLFIFTCFVYIICLHFLLVSYLYILLFTLIVYILKCKLGYVGLNAFFLKQKIRNERL